MTNPQDDYAPEGQPERWSYPAYPGFDPARLSQPPVVEPVSSIPPTRNSRWWWLVVPVVLVTVLAGGGLWWASRPPPMFGAERTKTVPPPPAPVDGCRPLPPGAAPAGWQPVGSRFDIGYDVPPDWTVNSCSVIVGWETACPDGPFGYCPVQTMSGSAVLDDPACPKAMRTMTGLDPNTETSDLRRAAREKALLAGEIWGTDDRLATVSSSEPRETTIGGVPAVEIRVDVTDIESDECTGPAALHVVVAMADPATGNAVVFVAAVQQGYPGAPNPELIERITSTLRPY